MAKQSNRNKQVVRRTNPTVLKSRALEEFHEARESGRLIAFTGSMVNVHLGYPSWKKMIKDYFEEILDEKSKQETEDNVSAELTEVKEVFAAIKKDAVSDKPEMEARLSVDLAEFILGYGRYFNEGGYEINRENLLKKFKLTGTQKIFDERPNINNLIFEELRVRRVLTLNYDLELEWDRFATLAEKQKSEEGELRQDVWKSIWDNKHGKDRRDETLIRHLAGRGKITSQILNKEDCNTLVEFALDAPDAHTRILHLHGRQDRWQNMLLSSRDYRDLYWRDGYAQLPFEYGLRSIFAGNSVLFIGLGLTEAEVMRTLEQFMSNNPSRIRSPHFVLWSSIFKSERRVLKNREVDEAANNLKRLSFFRRFGVHIIFDTELAEICESKDKKKTPITAYLTKIYDQANGLVELFPLEKVEAPEADADKGEVNPSETNKQKQQREKKEKKEKEERRKKEEKDHLKQFQTALRLEYTIKKLAEFCNAKWNQETWNMQSFRSVQVKYNDLGDDTKLIRLWGTANPSVGKVVVVKSGIELTQTENVPELKKFLLKELKPLTVITGTPGLGKGGLAAVLSKFLSQQCDCFTVTVNGSFANEIDSIMGVVSGLHKKHTAQIPEIAQENNMSRISAYEKLLDLELDENNEQDENNKPVYLVINGMERFTSHEGKALSAELDVFLRQCIRRFGDDSKAGKPPIKIILLGTGRTVRYVTKLTKQATHINLVAVDLGDGSNKGTKFELQSKTANLTETCNFYYEPPSDFPCYFKYVAGRFEKKSKDVSLIFAPEKRGLTISRKMFFAKILNTKNLKSADVEHPVLALEILKTMAFIGQPILAITLYPTRAIQRKSGCERPAASRKKINDTLGHLKTLGLIVSISPFRRKNKSKPPNNGSLQHFDDKRYGLHRSLSAEIRNRYGVPLSEAKLANSFNLSLFMSQPTGEYMPELEWHKNLGKMTDDLIGAYLDKNTRKIKLDQDTKNLIDKELNKFGHPVHKNVCYEKVIHPDTTFNLRAALSLMRNYYSTSALLMHNYHSLDPRLVQAPLTEHALRLKRLIRVAKNIAFVRGVVRNEKAAEDKMGSEALFPDDLVWLYNELGVVYLTQGKLYPAKFAFDEALDINNKYVEFGEKLQNWSSINLNILQLLIDRGKIEAALECIRDIESSIEKQAERFGYLENKNGAQQFKSAKEEIITLYTEKKAASKFDNVGVKFPRGLILSVGLCLGYRGLCHTLKGNYVKARQNYKDGIAILNVIGEVRAYAWFQKHSASAFAARGLDDDAIAALRLSIAASGSTQQTDIDHHARITLVRYGFQTEHLKKDLREGMNAAQRIPQLMETLKYAKNSDMKRLQAEVLHHLAWVHFANSDYSSALRYVSDAISVASKHGHGLRKVTLRAMMARILINRGDVDAGVRMLDSASRIATKIRFDKAVESVENIRVAISGRS